MAHPEFELAGGHPALNFLNTVHDWTVPDPKDLLGRFADALRFGEAAQILTRSESLLLARRPDTGELRRLRAFRALLARVFRAIIEEETPRAADLAVLAATGKAAAGAAGLRFERGRVHRALDLDMAGPALLRLRLAEAALGLLTATELKRVKSCPRCGWFFLDTTKNRSRRWCSMATCGASEKASRYYWKSRNHPAGRGGAGPR
jgi:predicted RNA-binding Zn ribbon-like protein